MWKYPSSPHPLDWDQPSDEIQDGSQHHEVLKKALDQLFSTCGSRSLSRSNNPLTGVA